LQIKNSKTGVSFTGLGVKGGFFIMKKMILAVILSLMPSIVWVQTIENHSYNEGIIERYDEFETALNAWLKISFDKKRSELTFNQAFIVRKELKRILENKFYVLNREVERINPSRYQPSSDMHPVEVLLTLKKIHDNLEMLLDVSEKKIVELMDGTADELARAKMKKKAIEEYFYFFETRYKAWNSDKLAAELIMYYEIDVNDDEQVPVANKLVELSKSVIQVLRNERKKDVSIQIDKDSYGLSNFTSSNPQNKLNTSNNTGWSSSSANNTGTGTSQDVKNTEKSEEVPEANTSVTKKFTADGINAEVVLENGIVKKVSINGSEIAVKASALNSYEGLSDDFIVEIKTENSEISSFKVTGMLDGVETVLSPE
jgi:hypothetical protein